MTVKKPRIFTTSFASVYPLYVPKAERKGRTKAEVDEVIEWLTGYGGDELKRAVDAEVDLETFFAEAPRMNPDLALIRGGVCGVRVEDVADPLMQKIRYLDKLVDELAKGKKMASILRRSARGAAGGSRGLCGAGHWCKRPCMTKKAGLVALVALVGCGQADPGAGVDSFDETACRKLAATVSGVAFTDAQATAVVDMIDHATAAELDAVPSVSPTVAKAIVAARPFGSAKAPLAKLDALAGVGPKALTGLRDAVGTKWCALADGRQACCGAAAPATPSVLINEYSPGPGGWVELWNAAPTEVDLGGFVVDDVRPGGAAPVTVAQGTLVPPHGVVVVRFGGINAASSDQVNLVDPKGKVVDTRASTPAGASVAGKCFGRVVDGGAWADGAVACTEGATNGLGCAAPGGTYDGVKLTAAEECGALAFLNQARFSELSALAPAARHVAYDCALTPADGDGFAIVCGYRSGAWASMGAFAGVTGIDASAIGAVKSAAATWKPNGKPYDTVESTFLARASLVGKMVSLDAVLVTKRTTDEPSRTCVEVRDTPGAKYYLAACRDAAADAGTACMGAVCTDAMVGKSLRLVGTVRASSTQPAGYRVDLVQDAPAAADARITGGQPVLDCAAIVAAAGAECGGLGYSVDKCLTDYLASHDANACTAELQGQMYDDT